MAVCGWSGMVKDGKGGCVDVGGIAYGGVVVSSVRCVSGGEW